ncbi:MAG: site-2 protease family protein [Planctomycetota bacterium]|nr:site-2 protease family protein [Planctomycetota bacterium]
MFGSFRIGSVAGIPIRVHVLFLLLVAALAFAPGTGAFQLVALGVLVVCVVLHELGHALVARRFGIHVLDITLWPLGGMARLSHIPESSRVEAAIAIAGPAVNVALALVAAPLLLLQVFGPARDSILAALALSFVVVNVLMAAFNLLPAFPTDGGRLVRAWFGRKRSWVEATARAVWIGRVVAVAIGIAGIAWGNWMLPVVALWLWWTGGVELAQVRARHAQGLVPTGGFTDADLARIESFRGPLRALPRGDRDGD